MARTALNGRLGGESKARAIVNFHCILRTLQLQKAQQTEPYGRLFAEVPMVGFSTYGDSLVGHINQTSTMLVFR